MWGGCHADHGVLSGNGGFEVKVVDHFEFEDAEAGELTSIGRFGWTVQDTCLNF